MRHLHKDNPFHKIQRWTGTHFRAADLWEVGTYILVNHFRGEPLCESLAYQRRYLEEFEQRNDDAEQSTLWKTASASASGNDRLQDDYDMGSPTDEERGGDHVTVELMDDEAFERYLEDIHQGHLNDDETAPFTEADDSTMVGDANADVTDVPDYLPPPIDSADCDHPTADAFNNSYVRIVHTNGIHHLAMVSCRCRGLDLLPLDLVASRLLPASFQNIRTLFSAQVLDHFRVCNLELKASAYQFYQLIRRLTRPTAPGDVVNLYDEFRRMSRLWRWMKKLKWAGYGHNGKDAMDVDSGELANYCPTCPQPGINLPQNWKEDVHRYAMTKNHDLTNL